MSSSTISGESSAEAAESSRSDGESSPWASASAAAYRRCSAEIPSLPIRDSVHGGFADRHAFRCGLRVSDLGCTMRSMSRHHAIDYIEITVTDLADAKRFYGEAFGWEFNDYGPGYAGICGAEAEVGGLRQDEETKAGGPFVLLYSEELDKSAEAVRSAGGQVVNGPYEFPGGRRFHFTDPSGNELGVWGKA